MSKILTTEDKKYLNMICRYLGSIGMQEAIIEIDEVETVLPEDIKWEEFTHFSNNYYADILPGLLPIYKKIFQYIFENDLLKLVDIEYMNYDRLEIKISCFTSEISASRDYGYPSAGDTEESEWDKYDGDDVNQVFSYLTDTKLERDNTLTVKYNGGGDSGYIESNFENGEEVPSGVEDWCYRQLNNIYGGWEINEGSQGEFIFDIENEVIKLLHQNNIDETGYDTIWEEKF